MMTVVLALNYSGSSSAVKIFNFIILMATLTTLVPYAFCAMAEVQVFFSDREKFSGWGPRSQSQRKFSAPILIVRAATFYGPGGCVKA